MTRIAKPFAYPAYDKSDKNWKNEHITCDMENAIMGNTSLNVLLPEGLKTFVKEQVATGRYSTPSDYVRELIRSDQKRHAKEQLDRLLLEGLDSPAEEVSPEYLEELRRAQTPTSLSILQTQAKKSGANRLRPEDIEKEIHAVRQESLKRDRR